MLNSLQKLTKILTIEAQAGYADKAIIGGLHRFYPTWLNEAKAEHVAEDLIHEIAEMFTRYAGMTIAERQDTIKSVLTLINSQDQSPGQVFNNQQLDRTAPVNSAPTITHRNQTPEFIKKVPSASPINSVTGLKAPLTILQGIGNVKSDLFNH